mmetsp:Transcript_21205/g.27388  ORF Transcript_21205/g.27388 Transcript_21205/m.27388 type:complete len:392 (-) Transcript_21205:213-1388(-)|eukprot:CAMPEP_0198146146 /NCGR_PEP_ID=MMETSP1443-20131203/27718_1 /TAXON_ID=186043 /ORGANISM="Entomoneis sp., Strain CCMP2396" /LENGTH=391 /DNA_ID=CAMNT_0043810005 /DNA_START=28 /DNA_END=1203 /DNA_ORIENTATION=-
MKGRSLNAKPQRHVENALGVVYVNDRCINCASCSNFAPETFSRSKSDEAHKVHQQPSSKEEVRKARGALAACPVAAIRLETIGERRHRATTVEEKKNIELAWSSEDELLVKKMVGKDEARPFPRQFLDDESLGEIYWLGHHNVKSFGTTPYLFRTSYRDNKSVWIMVDTPKFSPSAVKAVESLTGAQQGPDFLFLTHVDDTADHHKWAKHYQQQDKGKLKRIFHAGDLGRHNWIGDETLEHVETLLQKGEESSELTAYNLDGEILFSDWEESNDDKVVILHTPGHSPGSISLYRRPCPDQKLSGILFTGDTYGWTTRGGGKMSGFPMYGNDLRTQADTLRKLVQYDWHVIAPGHEHPRNYHHLSDDEQVIQQYRHQDLQMALDDMALSQRW